MSPVHRCPRAKCGSTTAAEQGEALFMDGQVRDTDGKPVAGAIVDVWHANTLGGYSFFDPSQPKYNLRRRIETDTEGRLQIPLAAALGLLLPAGTVRRRSC